MQVVIVKGEEAVLRVNLGCPIVTNGNFVAYCVKVHELMELSFEEVNGVSRGMGILEGVHVLQGKGVSGILFPHCFRGMRHFQAKCTKYSNVHIMETTAWIPTKFCTAVKTIKYASWVVQ